VIWCNDHFLHLPISRKFIIKSSNTVSVKNYKLQTRLLVREGPPYQQIRNCIKIIKGRRTTGRGSQMGAWNQDRLAYCPSVMILHWLVHSYMLPSFLMFAVDAPWYMRNTVIERNLQIPTVKEEIRRYSSQYSARLSAHPNNLIVNLIELPNNRRLRRHLPNDLPTRFLV
jgi:hypothetical protein